MFPSLLPFLQRLFFPSSALCEEDRQAQSQNVNQVQVQVEKETKMENSVVTVSGIQIFANSSISPERLKYFQAGNGNTNKTEQNITLRDAIALASALSTVPRFRGMMVFALPGTFQAARLPEDAVELSLLMREGLGADDTAFIHFIFPSGLGTVMNAALLLKAFKVSWQHGIQTIMLENYLDGGNPILTVASVPSVADAITAYGEETFGQFEEEKTAIDQFAIPDGLPIGRGLPEASTDPHNL